MKNTLPKCKAIELRTTRARVFGFIQTRIVNAITAMGLFVCGLWALKGAWHNKSN